jgi:hypothetical protein
MIDARHKDPGEPVGIGAARLIPLVDVAAFRVGYGKRRRLDDAGMSVTAQNLPHTDQARVAGRVLVFKLL